MESFLTQVYDLLNSSPGILAYYVVLSFTVVAALQSSINFWRRSGFPQGNRMVIGLGLLLLLQFAQFAVAGLAWQGVLNSQTWFPPLDRFVMLVSLILITWLWLVPEPLRLVDVVFFIVFVLAGAYLFLSLQWWALNVTQFYFNATWPDWASNWFAMILLGFGSLGLLIRRPNLWGIGLAMLALLFLGHLGQFLYPVQEADYSIPVRLAQLVAFPWLLALPQRFPIPSATMVSLKPAQTPTLVERRRYNTDPKTVQEFIGLLNAPTDQLCASIARLLSKMMVADYCLVVASSESDPGLTVACAYNLIEEKILPGFSLDARLAPMIVSAMRRNKPLRLPSSSTSSDLQELGQGLHLDRVGHLLAAPIAVAGHMPLMGVILLSPYSNRGWTAEDQDVLVNYTQFLARLGGQTDSAAQPGESLEQLQAELQSVQHTRQELLAQLESARGQAAQERARAESLAAMVHLQGQPGLSQPTQELRSQDQPGQVPDLEDTLIAGADWPLADAGDLPEPQVSLNAFEELQADLRLAMEQVAELRAELAQAEQRQAIAPFSVENQPAPGPSGSEASPQIEEIATIVTDMRQPLSSILGYADVLLGESVGILGALQRKFLERIRASAERMGGMTDDLGQLTALQEVHPQLAAQVVDVRSIIQNAVSDVQEQLAQRSVTLHTDIADHLPSISADQHALQQVFVSLLRNAAYSSPNAGEVQLKVRLESRSHEPGYILVQVTDSSEGISPQDLPRVFSRQSGDSSGDAAPEDIDLTLVKALVEAHGGRIWVDSVPGKGSTFSTLLPVDVELESE
jgi:signal transduction histidine kinase